MLRFLLPVPGLVLLLAFCATGQIVAAPYPPDPHFSRVFYAPGFNNTLGCAGTYAGRLVIGGYFTQFNGTFTGSLATWNEPDWTTLGFPFKAQPRVMREFWGGLYVGGPGVQNPDGSGGRTMAIYDGTSWTTAPYGSYSVNTIQAYNGVLHVGGSLFPGSYGRSTSVWTGTAFVNPGSSLPGTVSSMTLHGGYLIAVGSFDEEGGNGIRSVGRYDGTTWSSLGTGLSIGSSRADARAAVEFEGDLVVGGAITSASGTPVHNVARWNGSSWSDMGTALAGGTVRDLVVYGSELYASTMAPGANVFQWDGADWVPVGTGNPFGTYQSINDLEVAEGRLCAVSETGVAAWDGVSWTILGQPRGGGWLDDKVFSLEIYQGNLIAAGRFTHAGGIPANHIARWDGSQWHPLAEGRNPIPMVMTVHDGKLYTASVISSIYKIGVWDGVSWQNLDTGTSYGNIYAMVSFNGDLIAAGDFDNIGGTAASNIARWDGVEWHPLAEGVSGCDSPYIPTVYSLKVSNGNLYVGGTFTQAGTWTVGHVARWDGTSWYRLSVLGGVTDPCVIQWLDDVSSYVQVDALEPFGTGLAVGGHFGHVAGQESPLAAFWGPGWSPLSGTIQFNSWMSAITGLVNHNGSLFCAGTISTSASGGSAFSRWNGSDWEPMGIGSGEARAIVSDGNFVYVGGDFTEAGGLSSGHIAAWSELPVSGISEPRNPPPPAELFTVRPNPSRGKVTIQFSLAATGPVAVDVFDVAGRRVETLNAGLLDPGLHELTWDGRDRQQRAVSAGVYFLRLRTDEGNRVQRVMKVE